MDSRTGDRGQRSWATHAVGVVLGILVLVILGIVVFAVIRSAARLPMVPTTVALVLLYGAAGSLPTWLAGRLPMLGPWQPRLGATVGSSYQ